MLLYGISVQLYYSKKQGFFSEPVLQLPTYFVIFQNSMQILYISDLHLSFLLFFHLYSVQ